MKARRLCLIALLLLLPVACGGQGRTPVAPQTAVPTALPPPTLAPDAIALGGQVYAQYCAVCHGAGLEGQANWMEQNEDGTFRSPPHDASGHTWHHADGALVDAIRLGGARLPDSIGGTSTMPAFDEVLTDEEIAAVLDYLKSTWPPEIRIVQWEQTLRSEAAD